MLYGTYLGGAGCDSIRGLAVDGDGTAYLTGWTSSTVLPTRAASQAALGGEIDAFVATLEPSGNFLRSGSYLGGAGSDYGYGIVRDAAGAAYVTGVSHSDNFPVTTGVAYRGSGDAFLVKLTSAPRGIFIPIVPVR
jgi:hypothetical protein